jgi:hypothetical protein
MCLELEFRNRSLSMTNKVHDEIKDTRLDFDRVPIAMHDVSVNINVDFAIRVAHAHPRPHRIFNGDRSQLHVVRAAYPQRARSRADGRAVWLASADSRRSRSEGSDFMVSTRRRYPTERCNGSFPPLAGQNRDPHAVNVRRRDAWTSATPDSSIVFVGTRMATSRHVALTVTTHVAPIIAADTIRAREWTQSHHAFLLIITMRLVVNALHGSSWQSQL